MPEARGEIFVVDDDAAIRTMLSVVLSKEGYDVACFADGAAFLAAAKAKSPVCIILDVHIPGKSGLDILKDLNAQDYAAPIFIMSGSGDIPMAVEAIKHGALDFIQKPFKGSEIVTRVREAIGAQASRLASPAKAGLSFNFPGREPLSRREQEVLTSLAAGASNKEAARQLGISPRTVEVHRARIMEKLGAKNATDLMRIVMSEAQRSPTSRV
jgi:FixJ family two-component response regulator